MIRRFYQDLIQNHLNKYEQMVFISGPRQVGKTTIAKTFASSKYSYLNWDQVDHRHIILEQLYHYIDTHLLSHVSETKPVLILDEIHKFKNWKNHIKGVYDAYKGKIHIIVTGSAKLDIYASGGDSLMGRYFNYQIFPLSVYELAALPYEKTVCHLPEQPTQANWEQLLQRGGYPEPYEKNDEEFHALWQATRFKQLFREDIRDLVNIHNIASLELLGQILMSQVGALTNYSQLAKKVRVTEGTIRSWYKLLEQSYYCFSIQPWTKNLSRSILKSPKLYLYDWSVLQDQDAKIENFCALHLLKAINYWNQTGQGDYAFHYLRNKDQKEVDFLVSKNNAPWILIEVKTSKNTNLSSSLHAYQKQLQADHAFQVAYDMPYTNIDLFSIGSAPKIVPMQTFLSQLF